MSIAFRCRISWERCLPEIIKIVCFFFTELTKTGSNGVLERRYTREISECVIHQPVITTSCCCCWCWCAAFVNWCKSLTFPSLHLQWTEHVDQSLAASPTFKVDRWLTWNIHCKQRSSYFRLITYYILLYIGEHQMRRKEITLVATSWTCYGALSIVVYLFIYYENRTVYAWF